MENNNDSGKYRLPPQNIEAEMSVLGGILIDKDAIIKVADKLTAADFYKEAHARIFSAMLELYEQRQPIDALSLSNRLLEKKQLEIVGGQSYLATLTTVVPTASHIASYTEIVKKKATLRRLLEASSYIAELSFQEENAAEELVDAAEQKLFAISQNAFARNFISLKDILGEAFDRIDELHKERGKLRGLPTGFHDLDNLLAGLQRSDLIILAARPSVGKTSLALDIARNCAVRTKEPVGIFSLEMSKEQLVDRLLCAEAGVDLWKLRTGNLSQSDTDDDFPKIGHAMGILSEAPIYIDDTAGTNVIEIRTKARRLKMEHGLGLIIVDYLQLMESRGKIENRVLEVAEITRSLKSLARELNVPVLALSQLSRAVEQSKPAIPKLAHLRESGSIEQDADVVLFIYRKAADRNYRPEEIPPEQKYVAEIHVAKHRNGPTGTVRLFFNEQRTSFENLEKNIDEPTYFGE
jgi:replicative DNA helicase